MSARTALGPPPRRRDPGRLCLDPISAAGARGEETLPRGGTLRGGSHQDRPLQAPGRCRWEPAERLFATVSEPQPGCRRHAWLPPAAAPRLPVDPAAHRGQGRGGSPTSSLPPTVTCPAPVSAALELEGDGGAERLEPPRPAAAAAGGAGRPRHARPARARRRTDSPSSANAAYQRSGGGAGGRSPAIIGCPQPTDPPSLTKANEISPQAPPPRTRCKA